MNARNLSGLMLLVLTLLLVTLPIIALIVIAFGDAGTFGPIWSRRFCRGPS